MIEAIIGGIIALIATGAVVLLSEAATEMEAVNKSQSGVELSLSASDEAAIDAVKSGYMAGSAESNVLNDDILRWIRDELVRVGANDE